MFQLQRALQTAILATGLCLAACPLAAQMHKVSPPENVVRAIGVYEWTGDMVKPNASRLIPVSLFINGHLEDAGVYLARPVPFALDQGNVYEIQQAGVAKGTVDLLFARHLEAQGGTSLYDDGWFGYGTFLGPPKPKPVPAEVKRKRPEKDVMVAEADDDPDRPTLVRRPGSAASPDASAPPAAPGKSTTASSGSPADDPDRPTLTKAPGSAAQPADASAPATSTANNPAPPDDPDRPTLKKRSAAEAKQARKEADESSVTGEATSLNVDPDRPMLHRGIPAHALTAGDFSQLKGIPSSLHQMVAVSDAKNRPPHDFARPWQDDTERTTVLAAMQDLARAALTAYGPAPKPPAAKPSSSTTHRKAATPPPPPPTPLLDEELRAYTLSYGGDDTFIYMAHTDGEGATLRYVTIVAQRNPLTGIQTAIKSVTDAAHLDRTPRMHLVDVVDAEASNRASLLFELRGDTAREFALYRVIAARSDQIFVTGTTQ